MVGLFVRLFARSRDERGAGIVTALMISLTVFAMGAVWTQVGLHQIEGSSFEKMREQALHSGEAGLNYAVSRLAGDLDYVGTAGTPVPMADGTGEFEVEVGPVDPTDPDDLDRYVVARGYSPSKDAGRVASRQVEQQVKMRPSDGFAFALFASPGGIVGQNNSQITGDVYSAADINLANSTQVFGDVIAAGTVTTSNQNLVAGDIHAGGDVTIQNTQTTVQGSVFSGGNVSVFGQVDGHAQAAGSVTVDTQGSVAGTIAENSPPPDPPVFSQPSFTWDPNNYPNAASWTSASGFMSYWSSNLSSFSGAHRVNGGDDAANKIALDQKWTIGGDVTIVSDGPVTLSRDVSNGTGGEVTLAVISFSDRDPAILLSNNFTIPDSNVKILLFAPNGVVDFSQLKDFQGVVYGETIRLSQQFTLDYAPPEIPGFSWDASSATHFVAELGVFREVPFTPAS